MSQDHFNLLFLSSRNTARSIFAELVTNRLGRGKFTGFSCRLALSRPRAAARRGLGAAQAVERDARRARATARRFYVAAVPHARPDQPAFAAGGTPPGRRGSLTCTREAIEASRSQSRTAAPCSLLAHRRHALANRLVRCRA